MVLSCLRKQIQCLPVNIFTLMLMTLDFYLFFFLRESDDSGCCFGTLPVISCSGLCIRVFKSWRWISFIGPLSSHVASLSQVGLSTCNLNWKCINCKCQTYCSIYQTYWFSTQEHHYTEFVALLLFTLVVCCGLLASFSGLNRSSNIKTLLCVYGYLLNINVTWLSNYIFLNIAADLNILSTCGFSRAK